ncbi:manganese efflux pump [Cytobacillus suaedae]|nr:manganese efflux pump [Cytobacillus suaedae]
MPDARHLIAFILLGIIGAKMIFDSIISDANDTRVNPLNNKVLIYLSLDTSIDALEVGVSFAFLNVSILFSIICIAITTLVLSVIGIYIGKLSGERLKKQAGLFGGFVLMFIGTKILLEHLGFFFKE